MVLAGFYTAKKYYFYILIEGLDRIKFLTNENCILKNYGKMGPQSNFRAQILHNYGRKI